MTIERLWLIYKRRCVHPQAPPYQVWETRQAFYSGVFSMFEWLLTIIFSNQDIKENLVAIQQELENFKQEIIDAQNSNNN